MSVATEVTPMLESGRRVLRMEAEALRALEARLDDTFVRAAELILNSSGRVIVSGIGKSGIVGRKIAATLTSTGTPAIFLHPVEGLHGDLGIVNRDDVAILLSKSGESSELTGLMEYIKRLGVAIIAFTGRTGSTLGRAADVVLDCSVDEEACPYDLAPTTSSTAQLAMGDALAVALLQSRGFSREDFARLHPGGALGRKLTLRVRDVMDGDDYPRLDAGAPDAPVRGAPRREAWHRADRRSDRAHCRNRHGRRPDTADGAAGGHLRDPRGRCHEPEPEDHRTRRTGCWRGLCHGDARHYGAARRPRGRPSRRARSSP